MKHGWRTRNDSKGLIINGDLVGPRNENNNMKPGYVYILTNNNNTTLYVGVTAYLKERIIQHKEKHDKKLFTARYNLDKLVYYEMY